MSKEMISKIEAKISELENKVKQNSESVVNLTMNIDSQNAEKTRIQAESTFLSGAIQAFKTMISEIQASNTESLPDVNVEERN